MRMAVFTWRGMPLLAAALLAAHMCTASAFLAPLSRWPLSIHQPPAAACPCGPRPSVSKRVLVSVGGRLEAVEPAGGRGQHHYHTNHEGQIELAPMPSAFGEVLEMLRELDRNGSWPATSRRRSGLLKNVTRRESIGDSFTIGLFPPPLRLPHANAQLPALLDALLRLEKALCPDRPSSTTITINRHAEFRPHRDSGAGAGQSTSLIVGLGDYFGGSLMVEGHAHDIRYRGLEFDGWRQLHWTRPFRGERYSLVWYTPQGLEQPREALERGDGWHEAARLAAALEPVKIVTKTLAKIEAETLAQVTRQVTPRGPITMQRYSMVPPNVNFKSAISLLAIERLSLVNATNVQVSGDAISPACARVVARVTPTGLIATPLSRIGLWRVHAWSLVLSHPLTPWTQTPVCRAPGAVAINRQGHAPRLPGPRALRLSRSGGGFPHAAAVREPSRGAPAPGL